MPNPDPRRRGGRPHGSTNRDTTEFRAMIQDRVREFTEMKRAKQIAAGMDPADPKLQTVIDEYDPVLSLAIVAVDDETPLAMRNSCHSEVAQYLRPKLKSIEMNLDPDALESLEERRQLSSNLVALLQAAAGAKKSPEPEAPPPPVEKIPSPRSRKGPKK